MNAEKTRYSQAKKPLFFKMAAIGIACALCISLCGAQQSFVDQHGQLSVKGTRIVDKNGKWITLRGMSLYWSQWQPAFYNASCIKWLRDDWKCTIVRAAMAVQVGGYLTNPTKEVAKIKTVVQACIDLGIYVLILIFTTSLDGIYLAFFHDGYSMAFAVFYRIFGIIYLQMQ